jgi:versiconal hemiacetal acetate esterase
MTGFQTIKNASSFGGDTSKVFAIGSSAGAGLALSITNHYAKTSSASPIKAAVALGPVTLHPDNVPAEYQEQYTAYTENATDVPVIDKKSMLTFFGNPPPPLLIFLNRFRLLIAYLRV